MNAYMHDRIAREHADAMMAEAAAARRARQARRSRRAARSTTRTPAADQPQPQPRRAPRPGAAAAQFAARPFTAFQSWLAAGQL
jgi:hypothetical protein